MTSDQPAARARGPAFAIGALLLLAAAVRCWGLEAHALWHDELCSINSTEGHPTFGEPPLGALIAFVPLQTEPDQGWRAVLLQTHDNHPPLYFLALRAWVGLFGASAAGVRSLSVLASVATVLLGAALAGLLAGRRAAVVGALLLALAPIEYRYAQEARPYVLCSTFAMLATVALAALQTGRGRRGLLWLLYATGIVGAAATHYSGALVPVAHLAWWILAGRPAPARPPRPVIYGLLLCLIPLGLLLLVQYQVRHAEAFEGLTWLAGPGTDAPPATWLASRAHIPYDAVALAGGLISGPQSSPLKAAPHALLVAGLLLFGLRSGGRASWLIAILALVAPVTLAAVDLALGTHSLHIPRYALLSGAFLWVGAALGLSRLRGWPFAVVLVLVLAGSVDGIVRCRARGTLATDVATAAAAMAEAGCDTPDLVVIAGSDTGQYHETNFFVAGRPHELVVGLDGRIEETALQRPWRNVFLLQAPWRLPAIRERVGAGRVLRRTLAMEHLELLWFTEPPAG